jgi:hypothetical protein
VVYRIACISCPTLYRQLKSSMPHNCSAVCLEYDTRFRIFGKDFVPYDYNQPLDLPPEFEGAFDIVVADPPFLSEECLRKTALTVRYLMKKNVIVCTGVLREISESSCVILLPSPFSVPMPLMGKKDYSVLSIIGGPMYGRTHC